MDVKEQITTQVKRISKDAQAAGRQIWLASLGALGTVDDRRRSMFTEWVDRGREVKAQEQLEKGWRQAKTQVEDLGEKVEKQVEDSLTATLHLIGAPGRRDVVQLTQRVEELSKQVENLAQA